MLAQRQLNVQQYSGYVVGSRSNPMNPFETLWTVKVRSGPDNLGIKFTVEKDHVPAWIKPGQNVVFDLTSVRLGRKMVYFAVNVELATISH